MELQIESGVQLFSRLSKKPSELNGIYPNLFSNGGPFPKQIIEILGEDRHKALLDFIIRAILPKNTNNPHWKSCGVLLFNTDHHLTLHRIVRGLDVTLKESNIIDNRRKIVEDALKNLTILNCYGIEQLNLTFCSLDKIIQNLENVSLLVVDNLGAFYWSSNTAVSQKYLRSNIKLLQDCIKYSNLVLIYSKVEQNFDVIKDTLIKSDYKIIANKDSNLLIN